MPQWEQHCSATGLGVTGVQTFCLFQRSRPTLSHSLSGPNRVRACSRCRSQSSVCTSVRLYVDYLQRIALLLLHVWLYRIEAMTRVQFSLPHSLLFFFTPHLFTHKCRRLSWGGGDCRIACIYTFKILPLFPLVQPGHSYLLADASKLISSLTHSTTLTLRPSLRTF